VEREILFAERLRKPIFPVLLSGESWPRLANIQFADMQAGTAAPLPADLVTGLKRAISSPAPAASSAQPKPQPQPRRASPMRRWMLIGGSLLLVVVLAAVVALNAINQARSEGLQLTLVSQEQLGTMDAIQGSATLSAFSATQQENYLRNAATQTANAPGVSAICSPKPWFFTFFPGIREMLADPCPEETAVFVPAIRQDFENGYMLWYASTSQPILFPGEAADVPGVYVVTGEEDRGEFSIYDDNWAVGDASIDPGLTPPEGYYQPVNQLGKVWREQPGVRSALGWAVSPEQAVGGRFHAIPHATCNCVRTYVADGQGKVLEMVQGLTLSGSVTAGSWQLVGTYPFQIDG